jgi:hypothetical protein
LSIERAPVGVRFVRARASIRWLAERAPIRGAEVADDAPIVDLEA